MDESAYGSWQLFTCEALPTPKSKICRTSAAHRLWACYRWRCGRPESTTELLVTSGDPKGRCFPWFTDLHPIYFWCFGVQTRIFATVISMFAPYNFCYSSFYVSCMNLMFWPLDNWISIILLIIETIDNMSVWIFNTTISWYMISDDLRWCSAGPRCPKSAGRGLGLWRTYQRPAAWKIHGDPGLNQKKLDLVRFGWMQRDCLGIS